MRSNTLVIALATMLTASVFGQRPTADSAGATAAIAAFHTALQSNNPKAAMALIAPDALFIEGGNLENHDQYEKAHLPADIEFEAAVKSKYSTVRATVQGNTAWVISEIDSKGTFENRPVNFLGMELAVLTFDQGAWRIRSMHWSSHRRTE